MMGRDEMKHADSGPPSDLISKNWMECHVS